MPKLENKKPKWKKPMFPTKGIIIFMIKDAPTLSGQGYIEAYKDTQGRYIFKGTLIKDYDGKLKEKRK